MLELNMDRAGALRVAEMATTMRSLSRAEATMYGRAMLVLILADTGLKSDSVAIMHLTRAIQWNHQSAADEFFAAAAPGSHDLQTELSRRTQASRHARFA